MSIYFITTSTRNRFDYFECKILSELFVSYLAFVKYVYSHKLYAFCILYDHIHLLIEPETQNIHKFMQIFKMNFSRDANRVTEGTEIPESRFPALCNKVTINNCNKSQSNMCIEKYLYKLSQLHNQFSSSDQ
jgi:REP element-mobilizing transposase RayT